MKAKRLLFLVMAICLASGVKAQFYDGPDDIYFYVLCKDGKLGDSALIFNFDGRKACLWWGSESWAREKLQENPNYFEDAIETKEFKLIYTSSNTYEGNYWGVYDPKKYDYQKYIFSYDRQTLTLIDHRKRPTVNQFGMPTGFSEWRDEKSTYKKVDRSFFRSKLGRSKKANGTIYE